MINNFANNNAWISKKWLLWLIDGRGLKVKHLLQVNHLGTGTSHHLAMLKDGCYICDCCMGLNLGIPCHHYFQILTKVQGMKFHVGLVRTRCEFSLFLRCNDWLLPLYLLRYRWYQDPTKVDLSVIPPVSLEHCATATKAESFDHAIPFQLSDHSCAIPWSKIYHNCHSGLPTQYQLVMGKGYPWVKLWWPPPIPLETHTHSYGCGFDKGLKIPTLTLTLNTLTLCYDFRQLRQLSTVIVSKVRNQLSLEECKSWTCIVLLGLRAKVQVKGLSIKG